MATTFRAAKSRSQGREGWSVLFRHPMRRDAKGGSQRLRMGLSTKVESEADVLVGQLNAILADESYWTPAARERAAREFKPRVVAIFYDDMDYKLRDPWALRDSEILIPSPADGFTRVLVVGPTGAGKTTLVRQLIGAHPKRDRFPSTATSRTTVFDTEIVMRSGPFRAVVSFLPIDNVRSLVEECLVRAVSEAADDSSDEKVLERFLSHQNERFRLKYVLGTLRSSEQMESDSDEDEEDEESIESDEASLLSDGDRSAIEQRLLDFLARIRALAGALRHQLQVSLDVEAEALKASDRDAFLALLEDTIRDNEDAQAIIDDVIDEIDARFALIPRGDLESDRSGWPTKWTFRADPEERDVFIQTVNQFASNYGPNFGRLLTPVVEGLRVEGPFHPEWHDPSDVPALVLMDGEGLGHTPDSASSLPTAITRRYEQSDVILLVDNAAHPMPAAAQAVLRSVTAAGQVSKLAITFTHFDAMKSADNLMNDAERMAFVRASLENAIKSVDDLLGFGVGRALQRHSESNVFFVGGIEENLTERRRFTRRQLAQLLDRLRAGAVSIERPVATPVYDTAYLVYRVTDAVREFQSHWNILLTTEHWTRQRALTRRLGYLNEDHYDNLMPVATLIRTLSEEVRKFAGEPRTWDPAKPSEEVAQAAIEEVTREFFSRLHSLVWDRLWIEQLRAWQAAYDHHGVGSAGVRAQAVRSIYATAAPLLGLSPSDLAEAFVAEVRELFRDAAEAAGARVEP